MCVPARIFPTNRTRRASGMGPSAKGKTGRGTVERAAVLRSEVGWGISLPEGRDDDVRARWEAHLLTLHLPEGHRHRRSAGRCSDVQRRSGWASQDAEHVE